MKSQGTDKWRKVKQQLKYHFLLKKKKRFQIKRVRFFFVFPIYIQFCTHIVVLLELIQHSIFLDFLEMLSHMLISNLEYLPQSGTSNQAQRLTTLLIVSKKSHGFEITNKISNYHSSSILSNIFYDIFIVKQSSVSISNCTPCSPSILIIGLWCSNPVV